ncbi:MAG: signal peptidase I [Acidimicrobiales bacterium]
MSIGESATGPNGRSQAETGPGGRSNVETGPGGRSNREVVDSDRVQWSVLGIIREMAVLVVTALVIAVVIKTFVAQAFYIPSGSMLPQLQIDDRVVVSKVSYRLHDPRRGDIVVFDAPGGGDVEDSSSLPARAFRSVVQSIGLSPPSTDEYIKRVVALPGERVEGLDGRVLVDGRELIEPYLAAGAVTGDFAAVVVPPDTVWVMGDNRANSSDSRIFGPVPRSTVVGRALVRVWPLDEASFL